jgi:cytidine deaminase
VLRTQSLSSQRSLNSVEPRSSAQSSRNSRLRFPLFGMGQSTIQPETDQVVLTANTENLLSDPHRQNLRRVLTHAETAARLAPNYSGRRYGALVMLADGTEGLSTNVEASRQVTLCDLRLALSAAQNQWVEKQSQNPFSQATLPAVKTIYLVNGDPNSEDQPIPCSDCQEWLASPLCPAETEVVSLEKNESGNKQPQIKKRTVQEMLPLYKNRTNVLFISPEPISNLPVVYSERAKKVVGDLPESQIKTLLEKAKEAYLQGRTLAKESQMDTGAAVLFSPSGLITTGNRFDWSSRLHESAELNGAAQGFARINQLRLAPGPNENEAYRGAQKIQAIAYYGEDPNLPPIASLGRVARKKGSPETLILTIETGQIQVRIIRDFLPELYRAN